MKNPLVEALRQASDESDAPDDAAAQSDHESVAAPGEAAAADAVPDSGELELMESTQKLSIDPGTILPIDGDGIPSFEGGILPIDGDGIPAMEGGILPIDGDGVLPTDDSTDEPQEEPADAKFRETTSLAVPASELAVANDQDAHACVPPPLAAPHALQPTALSRLGLYSPLVCLVLAAAAAGTYIAYQGVVGWYQNRDLESLPSQIGVVTAAEDADAIDSAGTDNRFALIVGARRPAARSPQRGDGQAGGGAAARVSEVKSYKAAAPVTVQNASAGIDDNAYVVLSEAYAAYERGDDVAAEAAYRQALELAPRHPNALEGLAAILHRSGKFDESLRHYETLLSVEPDNAAAAAALLTGVGASPAAVTESEIKHLLQRHPHAAFLHFALGMQFAQQSRWAEARHAFDSALRLDSNNADYLFNLAVSLEHLGQLDDARYYYESALGAVTATSTMDSEAVAARIEKLALLSSTEGPAR